MKKVATVVLVAVLLAFQGGCAVTIVTGGVHGSK